MRIIFDTPFGRTLKYILKYLSKLGHEEKTFKEIGVPISWKFMFYVRYDICIIILDF